MAKLVALPSPNGTNIERLYVGQHGIVRQPPAYDTNLAYVVGELVAMKIRKRRR